MKKILLTLLSLVTISFAMAFTSCENADSANQSGEVSQEQTEGEEKNFRYEIEFISDGVSYATSDVINNNIEEMPADPAKDGYVFQGWYFDYEQWKKPLTLQVIMDPRLTENHSVKVYARFLKYNCGMDYKQHEYNEISRTASTCTQNGYKILECKNCGDVCRQALYATGHEYEIEILHEATCAESGTKRYSCTKCNYTYDETIPTLSHDLDDTKHCINDGNVKNFV